MQNGFWSSIIVSVVVLAFAAHSPGQDLTKPPKADHETTFIDPEVPDDPPADASARANALSRSQTANVQRGPFISVQVNVDGLGQNIVNDAANEPSIAVDPTNPNVMVIGWRQFDSVFSNFRQAGWAYSHDAGATWTFPGSLDAGVFRSDPVLVADADGNIYYYSLTVDKPQQTNFRCHSFESLDGGINFGAPVVAFGGDKAWFTVDRSNTIGRGNLYAKWQTFFNCCGNTTFTRSTDGGASFETPVSVPSGPSFGTVAVGPDGEVYVAGIEAVLFQNFGKFVIAKSTNARNPAVIPSFDFSTVVDMGGAMEISAVPNPNGLLGQAWVAVNPSSGPSRGHVYMLASVDPPGADPLDVMFSRSTDGGLSWSAPLRVNDDPAGNNAWQWFGTMSVAPSGRIDVIWNDTRADPTTTFSELYYSYSTNGGVTWSTNIPISPPFNHFLGYPQQNKLGDYYDMVSDELGANIAYAATFTGQQDVYFLRLAIDCNSNGIHDGDDIAFGTLLDCNSDGQPDDCQTGCSQDCQCPDPDSCFFGQCNAGACESVPNIFGDIDHNGTVNLIDLFCMLEGLAADFSTCSSDDMDIEPCGGNGTINLPDLFAVLNAFSDVDPCCGP